MFVLEKFNILVHISINLWHYKLSTQSYHGSNKLLFNIKSSFDYHVPTDYQEMNETHLLMMTW